MMRRRPSGESPSSCGGASVISALNNGSSVNGFEEPEKFAERAGRTAFLLLAPRVANEGAQGLQVGARMLRAIGCKGAIVGEELLAQRFEAPMARGFLRGMAHERVEPLTDRRRVDVAHQFS